MASARAWAWANEAQRSSSRERRARAWLRCATEAYRAATGAAAQADAAAALSTQCTARLIDEMIATEGMRWDAPRIDIAGDALRIDRRPLSASLNGSVSFTRADTVAVSTDMFGRRYATHGFGVALVASSRRCADKPVCKLLPPEAVTRPAVAWVESGEDGAATLVIDDPVAHPAVTVGGRERTVSVDMTAPYATLISTTQLAQQAVWTLLGGRAIGLRQGVYLLDDYDPNKIPIVMLHGLGASPLIWTRLTARIQGTPELHARYQVWHVLYPTDAPVLLSRFRVNGFLDSAWSLLDGGEHDVARQRMVLVGHSMGGTIARLLASQSDDVVWNAVFLVPANELRGAPADIAVVERLFHFTAYPGVDTAFFLAAPHHGSPVSDAFVGRLALHVVKPRSDELEALARLVKNNPTRVRPETMANYKLFGLSSISTLRMDQPVSRAASTLIPVPGVRYYTIAGNLAGEDIPGDGVVPVQSAYLPGAVSTNTVSSGHRVYRSDEAIKIIVDALEQ